MDTVSSSSRIDKHALEPAAILGAAAPSASTREHVALGPHAGVLDAPCGRRARHARGLPGLYPAGQHDRPGRGLILGSSFSAILNSFVVDILSPIISLLSERSLANYYWPARCPTSAIGCTSKTWETWKQARDAGAVTINYGLFVENVMNFLINAVFLFFAVKKVFEVVFKRNVLVKKQCPYCKEFVKGNATRCKECGSDIDSPPNARGG